MARSPEQIRTTDLAAPRFEDITVGRVPAAAASADPRIAAEHARRLAEQPHYFAEYGPRGCLVTLDEYLTLKREGAKEKS